MLSSLANQSGRRHPREFAEHERSRHKDDRESHHQPDQENQGTDTDNESVQHEEYPQVENDARADFARVLQRLQGARVLPYYIPPIFFICTQYPFPALKFHHNPGS